MPRHINNVDMVKPRNPKRVDVPNVRTFCAKYQRAT